MKLSDIPDQGPFTPKQRKFMRCRLVMADRCVELFDCDFVRELDSCRELDDMATTLMEGRSVLIRRKGHHKVTISFSDK